MKKINDFIAWLYIMITIAAGLLLIVSVSGWYGLKEKTELYLSEQLNSPTGVWTGFCLVVLGLLFLYLRIKAEVKQKTISFDNPEGEVTISVKAIEEFIKKVGYEFHNVIEMVPIIIPVRDGLKIKVKTSLETGSNVPRLAESIQNTIKSRMQNILGIENVTKVEVHISKLHTKQQSDEEPMQQNFDVS